MKIEEVVDIKTLIDFCGVYGVENVPYKFYGKHKTTLQNIKIQSGYKVNTPIKEIIYVETTLDKNDCVNCKKPTKYCSKSNSYKKYCCPTCCSIYNKEDIKTKRTKTMQKNMEDATWSKQYRTKISIKSNEYHQSELGKANNKIHSKRMKDKILDGVFTPQITNSWTRWTAEYNGKKYRSLFDALFKCYADRIKLNVEYEKLRIPYNYNNQSHVYIVDFLDTKNKQIYEIKPNSLVEDELNKTKELFAKSWCDDNGYKYNLISENELKSFLRLIEENEFTKIFLEKYPKWK